MRTNGKVNSVKVPVFHVPLDSLGKLHSILRNFLDIESSTARLRTNAISIFTIGEQDLAALGVDLLNALSQHTAGDVKLGAPVFDSSGPEQNSQ